MRTANSIKNTILTLIASFVDILMGWISLTLFIKFLDVEYLGINGLFSNILSMLSLTELGIGTAIIVKLYKPLHDNDIEKIKSLMHFYKKAYNLISLTMLVIGLLVIPFLKYIIKEVTVPVNLTIVYILHLLSTICSYLVAYKRSIIYAEQKDYILKSISICYYLSVNITQIIILYLTKNYYLYLIIKIICQLIQNIAISLIANHRYPYLKDKNYQKLDKKSEKDIFSKVRALSIHKVSKFIVSGTDNIIISSFLGLTTVGLYSNYNMIINNVNNIFYKIIESVSASVGDLLTESNHEKTYKIYQKIKFLNTWLSIFSATCLLVITQDFIKLWIGEKYLLSNFVLIILVLNYYQKLLQRNFKIFKDAAGIWKEDRIIPIIESIINIIASIILLKKFGLAGIFMGTIISSFTYWFYSYPKYIYKNLFKKSYLKYIKELSLSVILFLLIATLTYQISSLFIVKKLFIQLIIDILICCIIPNLVMIFLFYQKEEFKYFKNLLINILFKSKKNNQQKKELSMSEIKEIQLKELLYIKEICDKNNIDYFLTSGTLLGAVKYKGYISWDDDIDIGLKRKDYLKLIDILIKDNNPNYKVLSIYNTKDYYYSFAKLVCTKTKLIENAKRIKEMGVYIDIFPFDYYNEDYEKYLKRIKFFKNITIKRYRIKNPIEKSLNKEPKSKAKFIKIKGFIYSIIDILTRPLGYKFWVKKYDKLLSINKTGKYITRGNKCYPKFEAKLFEEFKEYEFEGYKFKSIKDADQYLKTIYGNYKKDLPKEKQRSHHQIKVYWK